MDIELLGYGDNLKPGLYKIHSQFEKASNFINKNNLISLVRKEIGNGPVNIVIKGYDFSRLKQLKILDDKILFNKEEMIFEKNKQYNSSIVFHNIDIDHINRNLIELEKYVIKQAPEKSYTFLLNLKQEQYFKSGFEQNLIDRIKEAWGKLQSNHLTEGMKLIKGTGYGLTPSGDDFIAGLLSGIYIISQIYKKDFSSVQDIIYKQSISKNILSNQFIFFARKGLFIEKIKNTLNALLYEDKQTLIKNAGPLLSLGATSGADFLTGFICSFKIKW